MCNCKGNGSVKGIYIINPNDVKSFNPLEMKRQYGKFKRGVFYIEEKPKQHLTIQP